MSLYSVHLAPAYLRNSCEAESTYYLYIRVRLLALPPF